MHHKLIEYATHEQLKSILKCMFDDLKKYDHKMYEEYEEKLYIEMYGYHFNEWMLEKAHSHFINEDGTKGAHWSLEQTNNVAKINNLTFTDFNQYDFNYVMNMIYSDYYGSVPNDQNTYYKMAIKFLNDKDYKNGKAFRYYLSISE